MLKFLKILLFFLAFAVFLLIVNVEQKATYDTKKPEHIIEVLDKYKNKSEITIYDIEEILKLSDTKTSNDEEDYDFLEILYGVLGE